MCWNPKETSKQEIIMVSDNDIADVLDVEALYTEMMNTNRKECVLRVGKDGVTFLDMKQKV